MALNATALTTLANLKLALGITSSSQDSYLESCIHRATAWIESETGRKLKARDYDGGSGTHGTTGVADEDYIYFDGSTRDKGGDTIISPRGLGEFYLPQFPVQKYHVTSNPNALVFQLAVLSSRDAAGGDIWDTDDLVENDAYIVDYANGVLRLLAGTFTPGTKNYRIKCTAGYQVGATQPYVTDDLEGLCIDLARQLKNNSKNLQSESIGTWSRSFAVQKEDPFVTAVLAKYSRVSL